MAGLLNRGRFEEFAKSRLSEDYLNNSQFD